MRLSLAVLMGALVASNAVAADTFIIDKGHSEAGFEVRHIVSKVHGRFTDFAGTIVVDRAKPEASSASFTAKTATIDTNNPDRDKDLRSDKFFDVAKYPELTFKSSKIVAKEKDRYDVIGTLTIRGVSKEVTLSVTSLGFAKDPFGTGERAGFEASTTINRKDFGMVWNKNLDNGGLLLGDEVKITVTTEAVKK
jgi:polyisoprenoid-binding protein YceI